MGVVGSVAEDVQDLEGEFEDGDIVDLVADEAPGGAESRDAAAQGFPDRGDVVIRGGQPVLEGEGVEEDEAADAQGGGTVFSWSVSAIMSATRRAMRLCRAT